MKNIYNTFTLKKGVREMFRTFVKEIKLKLL